jgi:hypothetical protein
VVVVDAPIGKVMERTTFFMPMHTRRLLAFFTLCRVRGRGGEEGGRKGREGREGRLNGGGRR